MMAPLGSRLARLAAAVPRPLGLGVLITVLIVALGGLAGALARQHYRQSPSFCRSCHPAAEGEGQPAALSAHEPLGCGSCHDVGFFDTTRQLLSGRAQGVPHAAWDEESCRRCHLRGQSEAAPAGRLQNHRGHLESRNGIVPCRTCHDPAAHGFEPQPDACRQCHPAVVIHERGMAGLGCLSCHGLIAGGVLRSAAADCRRCHDRGQPPPRHRRRPAAAVKPVSESRLITADDGHGGVGACPLCHQPHSADPKKRRLARSCRQCHAEIARHHDRLNDRAHPDCSVCHLAHEKRAQSCGRCHQSLAQAATAAAHRSCGSCHQPHGAALRAPCAGCHKEQQAELASWRSQPHSGCGRCHAIHRATPAADACVRCHRRAKNHGHGSCATCHAPHGGREHTLSCESCHQSSLGGGHAKSGHRRCQSCHDRHAPGSHSRLTCLSCHQDQQDHHPQAERCTGRCHRFR